MAGRGSPPQQTHSRERDTKRRQAGTVAVSQDGVIRGPEFPDYIVDPHPATKQWWETWRASPQAQLFEPTDWEALLRAAVLHNSIFKSPKPSVAALAELRLLEERFGGTYVDRQRAKIVITKDVEPSAATTKKQITAQRNDVKARLAGRTR